MWTQAERFDRHQDLEGDCAAECRGRDAERKRNARKPALRCLSQAVGRYGASKMVCQLHYELLADGSLLDDDDTLAEYFGTNLPIETMKGLLRQEFNKEFEEEVVYRIAVLS